MRGTIPSELALGDFDGQEVGKARPFVTALRYDRANGIVRPLGECYGL